MWCLSNKRLYISRQLAAVVLVITNSLLVSFKNSYFIEDATAGLVSFAQERRGTSTTGQSLEKENNNNKKQTGLAYRHSFGFFDDIPDGEWVRYYQRPAVSTPRYANSTSPNEGSNNTAYWQYHNLIPSFSCPRLRKVGGTGDGPKWTCDPDRLKKSVVRQGQRHVDDDDDDQNNNSSNSNCLVYSIGSNGNYRFEDGLHELLGGACEIHVFDPGNYEREGLIGKNMHYHRWGLTSSEASQKGVAKPRGATEMYSFQQIQQKLGHENRTVDIFKIDCEGCEWFTYKDWIEADIRQILIETHHLPLLDGSGKFGRTKLPAMNASDYFDEFEKNGFVLFNKEANSAWGRGACYEWSYLKLDREFFRASSSS